VTPASSAHPSLLRLSVWREGEREDTCKDEITRVDVFANNVAASKSDESGGGGGGGDRVGRERGTTMSAATKTICP
jgi:hypothetical protein